MKLELKKNWKLVYNLAKNDFKSRYVGSFLGIVWAFIQPIVTIAIYAFIFGSGLKQLPIGEEYPFLLYLIAGIIPYFYVNDAINSATNSIVEYSYIIKKVIFNINLIPLIKILTALFIHLFFILLGVIVFLINGKTLSIYFIQVIYYSFCAIVLSISVSYFTAAITVFFRDMAQIVSIIMQFLMWLTPIMYDLSIFPQWVATILKYNPLYYIVQGYRDSFINHVWFFERTLNTLYFWGVMIVLYFISIKVFNKLKNSFADVL